MESILKVETDQLKVETDQPSTGSRGMSDGALELAVVVPTFNEAENVEPLLERILSALDGHDVEIIFVDDNSPDGTAERVRAAALRDGRIRCIHRIGRRGLASAVIEGALATAAPVVAVIDGDMQHDESLLPKMLETLRLESLELVVGSRYLADDGMGDLAGARIRASRLATNLVHRLTRVKLTDPMSGFFMVRTDVLRGLVPSLSCVGFKILLDIFMSASQPLRFAELPYRLRSRQTGDSKMDVKTAMDLTELLIDKMAGRLVPPKFVMFAFIGSIGLILHLLVLWALFKVSGLDFVTSQVSATLSAMTLNFALNNALTYADRRLVGIAWIKGWFSFTLVCSVGAVANVGVASYLFSATEIDWLLSGIAGVLVGVVWNYAVTSLYTWKA